MHPVAILAGGLATRINPVTKDLPKSLVKINGVPFVDLQLSLLSAAGFTDVILLLGHLGDMIETHIGEGKKFGLSVRYSYDGNEQLGTGGAIVQALPLLADPFCVLYGDSYLPMNYEQAIKKFENSGKLGLMSIYRNLNPNHVNNVDFNGQNVLKYSKVHPPIHASYIDHGFGMFYKKVFDSCLSLDSFDLSSVTENLAATDQLEVYESEETFYEIGSFEGIKTLDSKLKREHK
jgi:MurNAc alpha-1-phosphate uridylyltransferase